MVFTEICHLKLKHFFRHPGAVITFSSLPYIWNLRNNCLIWCRSVNVKGIFNRSIFCCSVIHIFFHICSMWNNFFNNTLWFSSWISTILENLNISLLERPVQWKYFHGIFYEISNKQMTGIFVGKLIQNIYDPST